MKTIIGKYNSADVYTDLIEESAEVQIKQLCDQPFTKDCRIAIMPDVHAGAGCVIGFTANLGDLVIPNLIGVDIGCGMLVVCLGKTEMDNRELDNIIHNHVPAGMNTHDVAAVSYPALRDLHCYNDLKNVSRIECSLGTLGGGNHFIEVDVDDGNQYLVIHTGSRNLGKQVAEQCISRLDYGKKYCTESITVDEQALQRAIVRALNRFNVEDEATYLLLMKSTIGEAVGINGSSDEIDLLERRIDALNKRMLDLVSLSVQEGDDAENHEDDFKNISTQIEQLTKRITAIRESESENGDFQARLKEIQDIIDKRRENKDIYDDSIVRQMVECIKVYHDGRLQIILGGGYELEEYLEK